MKYEAHITCLRAHGDIAARVAKDLHWKTSEIAGDPVLGKDTYFYLTSYNTSLVGMRHRLGHAVAVLREEGVTVVREKIEEIVHDVRY